ncbi:Subunit of the glycosylphosphatidylinositol transamidase complex-like protein [Dimargaris cristalligena]|nr:Subunit of the glycosylphosphatidylinositol transamidase complex-like protein [Dimargaris cristalligena]
MWSTLSALVVLLSGATLTSARPESTHAGGHPQPPTESFSENLLVNPLTSDRILSHFEFVTATHLPSSSVASDRGQHYRLFPRLIGQILHKYGVEEFHLTLTQGRWDYDSWGYPVEPSTATGLELWTRLVDSADVEERWRGFNNALSGLFCASINFVDQTITSEPSLSFRPNGQGMVDPDSASGSANPTTSSSSSSSSTNQPPTILRHSLLARESVCTENLTPWIKLLPCQGKAGLTSLLNTYRLYDTNFHSMGIHLARTGACPPIGPCGNRPVELRLSLALVTDRTRLTHQPDRLLSTLFDRHLEGSCPLATQSRITLLVPEVNVGPMRLVSEPSTWDSESLVAGRRVARFDLHHLTAKTENRTSPFEIYTAWSDTLQPTAESNGAADVTPLTFHRQLTGHGLERNGLEVTLSNFQSTDVTVTYLDTLPWYLNVYFHTLTIRSTPLPEPIALGDSSPSVLTTTKYWPNVPQRQFWQPSHDHGRPSVMELGLQLPAQSLTILTLEFDKMFLKYTEYPPDANRGMTVGSAVLTAQLAPQQSNKTHGPRLNSCVYQNLIRSDSGAGASGPGEETPGTCWTRMYSEPFLVSLPTPDFSMPYNVIAFTCTVLAFFFGSMFNSLIRGYRILEPAPSAEEDPKPSVSAG